MTESLVTVITPTWNRHHLLTSRCMPSVEAQSWPNIEHLIIADGPDPLLRDLLTQKLVSQVQIRYCELPARDNTKPPHTAASMRQWGIKHARGAYVAYLDDDDAYRPNHVSTLAAALDWEPEAGWVYSQMLSHRTDGDAVIGVADVPGFGDIGTPMIMHRRGLTEVQWGPEGPGEDYEMVQRLLLAGIPFRHMKVVTVDVWPSAYW